MEAQLIGGVSHSISSTVSSSVRVASLHDERLVVCFESADLLDLDAIIRSQSEFKVLFASHVLIDDRF